MTRFPSPGRLGSLVAGRFLPTLLDPEDRNRIHRRLRSLKADSQARWGRMTAPRMIAHLTDQMHHTLGDVPCRPRKSWLSLPIIRQTALYLVPWPKGRIEGPRDAFVTSPGDWSTDVEGLAELVDRFGLAEAREEWPPHALFGPMTHFSWGVFCYRHFDHHLRQFGA